MSRAQPTLPRHATIADTQVISQISLDMANLLVVLHEFSQVSARFDQLQADGVSVEEIERRILETDLHTELTGLIQCIEVNERMAQVIGARSKHDAVQRFMDIFSVESEKTSREFFVSLLFGREFEAENQYRHLETGDPLYFQIRTRIVRQGKFAYVVTVLADLTAHTLLQKKVEQSESRMQMAIAASQAGIWEVDIPTMTFSGDRAYYELLGYQQGSVDGLVTIVRSYVHPDDIEESVKLTSAVYSGEQANQSYRLRIKTNDDRYRWFQLRLKATEFDGKGKPLKAIGTLTDVHDDERTERLLRLERDLLSMRGDLPEILATLALGIETEWDGCRCVVLHINGESKKTDLCVGPTLGQFLERKLLGLSTDELKENCRRSIVLRENVCSPWSNPYDDDDCPEYLKSICKFTTSAPLFCGNEIRGVVCVLHDEQPGNSERALIQRLTQTIQFLCERQFHADLEAEFEAKILTEDRLESLGKLAGGVAHDFNNLLTVMLAHTELIQMNSEDVEILSSTKQIVEAAGMATNLCRKMLTYAGASPFEPSEMNLTEAAADVVDMMRNGTAASHEFHTNYATNLPMIVGDSSMVSQLILNLITNAVEAIPHRGKIAVTTGCRKLEQTDFAEFYFTDELTPGDFVFVSVADNGCGMSPEVAQRIFDPFFTTKTSGSGLGLSTVIGAVRRHAGCLAIASEPAGGTTVSAYFPVATLPQITADVDRTRVAIVDDDDAVRLALQRLLVRRGYDVVAMESGEKALECIHELGQCDLLILDQQMPGMNGLSTFLALRKKLRALPVCFVSGYKFPAEISNLVRVDKRCGAIMKPFTRKAIDEAMNRLLGAT